MSSADVRAGKILFLKNYKIGIDLSSQIDGFTTKFILPDNIVSGTSAIYLNGLRQQIGAGNDYEESAINEIAFSIAPDIGDILISDYIKK